MKVTPYMIRFLKVLQEHPTANATNLAFYMYKDDPKYGYKLKSVKNQGNGACGGMNLNYVVAGYRAKLVRAGFILESYQPSRSYHYYLTTAGEKALKEVTQDAK